MESPSLSTKNNTSKVANRSSPTLATAIPKPDPGAVKVVEFCEAVLKRLHISKAKARLKEIHADLLHQYLQRLQESDDNECQIIKGDKDMECEDVNAERNVEDTRPYSPELVPMEEAVKEMEEEPGSFSPKLLYDYEGEEGLDPEVDKEELERRRVAVLEVQQHRLQEAAAGPSTVDESIELAHQERTLDMRTMGVMEEGDVVLGYGAEVNLESQVYWGHFLETQRLQRAPQIPHGEDCWRWWG